MSLYNNLFDLFSVFLSWFSFAFSCHVFYNGTVSIEMTMNLKSKTIDSDPHLTNIKMRQDIKLQNCSESAFFGKHWTYQNVGLWIARFLSQVKSGKERESISGYKTSSSFQHCLQVVFDIRGVTVFKVKKYKITWPLILPSVQWPLISLWWYWRTDSRSKARGVFHLCFSSLWP